MVCRRADPAGIGSELFSRTTLFDRPGMGKAKRMAVHYADITGRDNLSGIRARGGFAVYRRPGCFYLSR